MGRSGVEQFEKQMPTALKRQKGGMARDMFSTSHPAGTTWYRLAYRLCGRNVQGATTIVAHLQLLMRPATIIC